MMGQPLDQDDIVDLWDVEKSPSANFASFSHSSEVLSKARANQQSLPSLTLGSGDGFKRSRSMSHPSLCGGSSGSLNYLPSPQICISSALRGLSPEVSRDFFALLARVIRLEDSLERIHAIVAQQSEREVAPAVAGPLPIQGVAAAAAEYNSLVSRVHLDRYCLPVLEEQPEPSTVAINGIVHELEMLYPTMESKQITSQIRKWFRKRREEMATRVVSAFKRRTAHFLHDLSDVALISAQIEHGVYDLSDVIRDARLELPDYAIAYRFAATKILSHLNRNR